jgi:ribosome-associated protein
MDIRKLQRAIVDGLEDVKAQDIAVFNTEHLTPLFERVIVASGTSNRQTKALASSVRDAVKARGFDVLRTEGEGNGEWIIVDCGAAVAHIMQPEIRRYYHLEEIWGEKPVALKRAAARGLVKAEEPAKAPAAKSVAGRKTSAGTSHARKSPTRRSAAPTSGPAEAAPAPKASARKATSNKAPARKASVAAPAVGAPVKVARKAPSRAAPKVAAPTATVNAAAPARKAPARKTSTAAPAGAARKATRRA